MKRVAIILFLSLSGFFWAGLSHPAIVSADIITLRSGKKVSGKIVAEDDKEIVIEMTSGIQLSFKKELILDEQETPKVSKQEAPDVSSQDVEPGIDIIDAKMDVVKKDTAASLEERQQVMAFLNKTSTIDDKLKEILSAKAMKFNRSQADDNKEKARDIIDKRIKTIEKAIKDLKDITPPSSGRDFYDTLNEFYSSMLKAEHAMFMAITSDGKENNNEAIEETLQWADRADQALKKLLNDYDIIDVQQIEKSRKRESQDKEAYEKNKKEYEAQMAEIKENKMKQEKKRQRREFLRYLNYF